MSHAGKFALHRSALTRQVHRSWLLRRPLGLRGYVRHHKAWWWRLRVLFLQILASSIIPGRSLDLLVERNIAVFVTSVDRSQEWTYFESFSHRWQCKRVHLWNEALIMMVAGRACKHFRSASPRPDPLDHADVVISEARVNGSLLNLTDSFSDLPPPPSEGELLFVCHLFTSTIRNSDQTAAKPSLGQRKSSRGCL